MVQRYSSFPDPHIYGKDTDFPYKLLFIICNTLLFFYDDLIFLSFRQYFIIFCKLIFTLLQICHIPI